MKYRKKPVIIEAFNYMGDWLETIEWAQSVSDGNGTLLFQSDLGFIIKTLEGEMHVSRGDWVICGVNGEFYPCKPDIFEKTYEEVIE